MGPQRFAGFEIVTGYHLLFAALFLGDRQVADHGKSGPTRADFATPDLFRRRSGPVTRQANAPNRAVAFRTQKPGIITITLHNNGNGLLQRFDLCFQNLIGQRRPPPSQGRHDIAAEIAKLERGEDQHEQNKDHPQTERPHLEREPGKEREPDQERKDGEQL